MSLFQADTTMKTKSVNDNKGKHGPGEVLCCPIGTKKAKHMKQQAEMFDRGVKKFGILSTPSLDGEESVDSCAAVPSSTKSVLHVALTNFLQMASACGFSLSIILPTLPGPF